MTTSGVKGDAFAYADTREQDVVLGAKGDGVAEANTAGDLGEASEQESPLYTSLNDLVFEGVADFAEGDFFHFAVGGNDQAGF